MPILLQYNTVYIHVNKCILIKHVIVTRDHAMILTLTLISSLTISPCISSFFNMNFN